MANQTFSVEQVKESLTRKVGPLPVWGWGAIILAGLLYWRYTHPSEEEATAYAEETSYGMDTSPGYYDYGPATGDAGGGSTGGSAGGDYGYDEEYPDYGYDDLEPISGPYPAPGNGDKWSDAGLGGNERSGSRWDGSKWEGGGRGRGGKGKDRNKTVSGKRPRGHRGRNKVPPHKKHNRNGKANKQRDPSRPYKQGQSEIDGNRKNRGGSSNGRPHAGLPHKSTHHSKRHKKPTSSHRSSSHKKKSPTRRRRRRHGAKR